MTLQRPRTQRLAQEAQLYITEKIMPLEALISLPVPVVRDSRLVAVFFGTLTRALPGRANYEVYRAPVRIYVDWEGQRVLDHVMMRDIVPVDQDQPVGLLLSPEFSGGMTEELEERYWGAYSDVYRLLDDVGPVYVSRTVAPFQLERLVQCERAYRRVVHPDTWPLYEELNPDFFLWLAGAAVAQAPQPTPATSRFCAACGAPLGAGLRFCMSCGAPVAAPRPAGLCPQCGVQNQPESRFCAGCGNRLG